MSFKQKVCENNSPSKPKDALSAAHCFCRMQCSNTDIVTNWLMIAAKAGELFKYFQTWWSVTADYTTDNKFYDYFLRMPNVNAHHLYLNNNDVTAWRHKWNHSKWCTIVAVGPQLHNSIGLQLSLYAYWEEQSWNLLNAPRTVGVGQKQ